jgi:uncharacterized repeat protein (TIGR01451 family)
MKRRSALVLVVMIGASLIAAPRAVGHPSPAGCFGNRFALTLASDVLIARVGDTITYTTRIANAGPGACDVGPATITLTLPAADGTPTGQTVTLATNATFPAGTSETTLGTTAYTVAVDSGVASAVALVSMTGALHDTPPDSHIAVSSTLGTPIAAAPTASTTVSGSAAGSVSATLSLSLGAPASFGAFTPGTAADYVATMNANVTSTAGNGLLTVADSTGSASGHLVNGAIAMPQALQVSASSTHASGFADAPLRDAANPTPLLSYAGPVANDAITVRFKQSIAANDPLRTGSYSKLLTFTLSTTQP